MKLIGAVFLLIVFISFSYAQDLFDQAEIEFNIDYIDIDKVKVLGSKNKGQIIAVWMKSGSVLTKTLSKSKGGATYGYGRATYNDGGNEVYNYESNEDVVALDLKNKSADELIIIANDIIASPDLTYNYKWSTTYSEELNLLKILEKLDREHNAREAKFVQLAMGIITANLGHGVENRKLYPERMYLEDFAKGDEQLTELANDFLKENGFNEEK